MSAEAPLPKLLVTVAQASEMLQASRSAIYTLLASGELQSVRLGRSRRIPMSELEAYVTRLLTEVES